MPEFSQIALIYEIPEDSWQGQTDQLSSLGWQSLKLGFFIEPLRESVTLWQAEMGVLEAKDDKPAAPGGQVLLVRYFDQESDTPVTTLAVYLPSDLQGMTFTDGDGLERNATWQMHARRQLGRMLSGHVRKGEKGGNPFQPIGRAAHIKPGSPHSANENEAVNAASQFLRGSNTLGEKSMHWYEPDDGGTKVLGTASGFVVLSSSGRFFPARDDQGRSSDMPSQFERFLVLQGLAYAYRQALLAPSRWLAKGLPTVGDDIQTSEVCYQTVRELHDRQVQFEARYLFSSPVEEEKAEVHGMAKYFMERNGLDHLREDLNAQLDRLQGLAQRFLAEREATRREQEARSAARRQRSLNWIVTILGLALAASQTLFGWLTVGPINEWPF